MNSRDILRRSLYKTLNLPLIIEKALNQPYPSQQKSLIKFCILFELHLH